MYQHITAKEHTSYTIFRLIYAVVQKTKRSENKIFSGDSIIKFDQKCCQRPLSCVMEVAQGSVDYPLPKVLLYHPL